MSAADRHHRACRELVLRADIYSGPEIDRETFYQNTVIFNRYAAHAESQIAEYTPYRHIPGVFN